MKMVEIAPGPDGRRRWIDPEQVYRFEQAGPDGPEGAFLVWLAPAPADPIIVEPGADLDRLIVALGVRLEPPAPIRMKVLKRK